MPAVSSFETRGSTTGTKVRKFRNQDGWIPDIQFSCILVLPIYTNRGHLFNSEHRHSACAGCSSAGEKTNRVVIIIR